MAAGHILLVEDDGPLAQTVSDYLANEGFAVQVAGDGTTGLRLWQQESPDLIILDWMLPAMSGLEVCRRIRQESRVPVIMLTARSEETDKLLGLELGADDYLTKPFSLRELVARVRAVLRRAQPEATGRDDVVRFGEVAVDLVGHTVRRGQDEIPLTATEFKLLAVLAKSPGRVFSRLQLMEAALGEYYEGYERTIDTHISRLRHKIEAGAESRLITTVHGVGYKLVLPGK